MTTNFRLNRQNAGLLIIDFQERLFPAIDRSCEVLETIQKVVKGLRILHVPIIATEQYPRGLGSTVAPLKALLGPQQRYLTKTTFSCLGDEDVKAQLLEMEVSQWILVGIEAHVCILQSAKDLLFANKQVVVLNDAISSRSIYDFSTAIAELRDIGVRVTSAETVLFELVRDAKAAEFKNISNLVK